jgi:cob(I)alamin adenosyltransferase
LSIEVIALESSIDEMVLSLPPLVNFIYPLGSQTIATIHIARTICRRAERKLVAAGLEFKFHPSSLHYLNRLSDWLFTLARYVAENNQIEECILAN